MAQQHYFQIPVYRYLDNPFGIGKIGVAFEFDIVPDGDDASAFRTKVIFTIPYLALVGKEFASGTGAFLWSEERKAGSKFFRYAFSRLKDQLETSSLTNHDDISVVHNEAKQLQMPLPKQCDFRASTGGRLFCCADLDNPIETSIQLCERCILPEPVRRCHNLRIQKAVGSKDSQGKYQITPECYCLDGNTIPSDSELCLGFSGNEPACWVPYKFYLPPPPKPSIGFKT